ALGAGANGAREAGDQIDEDVPVIFAIEIGEGNEAFELGVFHLQPRLFKHLSGQALLWRLARLELSAETVELTSLMVCWVVWALQHHRRVTVANVGKGAEFQSHRFPRPLCSRSTSSGAS